MASTRLILKAKIGVVVLMAAGAAFAAPYEVTRPAAPLPRDIRRRAVALCEALTPMLTSHARKQNSPIPLTKRRFFFRLRGNKICDTLMAKLGEVCPQLIYIKRVCRSPETR